MTNNDIKTPPGSRSGPGGVAFSKSPRLIGHRGAMAVAPENTLASFRQAAIDSADWIEFDVRLAADGIPVIFHDDDLERTSNGAGAVAGYSAARLKTFDAGAWFGASFAGETIPTLRETISLCRDLGLGMNIEIKPNPGEERATALVALETLEDVLQPGDRWLAGSIVFSSFKLEALEALRDAGPDWPRGLLISSWVVDWRDQAKRLDCVSLHPSHGLLDSAKTVSEIKDEGLLILPYTVNDPSRASDLFDWGVDAIITDDPRLLSTAGR
ncbi:MAG: glycerophosphoryl diester phosphodiesterase [Alphaproteobacteria bacterium]|jgi:glycerophosphoryl diester phosphodiesterase|nr:glycerophosphoryl diester phosphodiesterase [Alphaproteobacteria bacterium]